MNLINEMLLLFLINIFFYIVSDFLTRPGTSEIQEPVFWKCSCRGYRRKKGRAVMVVSGHPAFHGPVLYLQGVRHCPPGPRCEVQAGSWGPSGASGT